MKKSGLSDIQKKRLISDMSSVVSQAFKMGRSSKDLNAVTKCYEVKLEKLLDSIRRL
jgi:hypothetical protein